MTMSAEDRASMDAYFAFRRENSEKYAEFAAWLDKLIEIGPSYAHFPSAQYTHKQLKAVRRELRKLTIG